MITKFGRGTTLKQAIEELRDNEMNEITKITSRNQEFVFEYEVEK